MIDAAAMIVGLMLGAVLFCVLLALFPDAVERLDRQVDRLTMRWLRWRLRQRRRWLRADEDYLRREIEFYERMADKNRR